MSKKSTSIPTQPDVNQVWKLKAKPEVGSQEVEVVAANGNSFEVKFGRMTGDVFVRRTHYPKGKTGAQFGVRGGSFDLSQFAEFIMTVERNDEDTNMANKKDAPTGDAPVNETVTVPVDENGNEIPQGTDGAQGNTEAKKKLSPQERAQAILDAENERQEAKKKKEQEKAQAKADKRATKLREVLGKTAFKEGDVAEQFSSGRVDDKGAPAPTVKKFEKLTEDEFEKALAYLKEEAKKKEKADALAVRSQLSDEEAAELKSLEKIVEKNLSTFQTSAFQIGGALAAINAKRLYRAYKLPDGTPAKTFELYVLQRFEISRAYAYSIMNAAETFTALTEGQIVDAKSLPSIAAAEAIHRGVKGLLKEAVKEDNPELDAITRQVTRNVYQLAVQNAPRDPKTGEPILSPDHLNSTFAVLNEVAKSGVVELEGKAVPVNLAATALDEMITEKSAERVAAMKATLAERIAKAKEAAQANKGGSKLDSAIGSMMDRPVPDGVVPRINAVCSFHGRCNVEETSDNDIRLECGCVFVSTPEGYIFEKSKKPEASAAA